MSSSSGSRLVVVLGLLVGAVCVLAYLEWWRAGEMSTLADRLAAVENGAGPKRRPPATRPRASSASSSSSSSSGDGAKA